MNSESKRSVCMVCSGNICRSPYAEFALRHRLSEVGLDRSIEVSSGGTLNIEGQPAHQLTLAFAAERGLNLIGFRSRGIDPDRVKDTDLFVALGSEHLAPLRDEIGIPPNRIWLITHPGVAQIPSDAEGITDPIGFDELPYRQTLEAIDRSLPHLTDVLRTWAEGDLSDR